MVWIIKFVQQISRYNCINKKDRAELQEAYLREGMDRFYDTLEIAISKFDELFVSYRYIFECRHKGVEAKLLYELLRFFRNYTLGKLQSSSIKADRANPIKQ